MALPICFESLLRTFFTTLKVAWDFWFYVLAGILLLTLLKQGKLVMKILVGLAIAFVIAMVLDFIGISFLCEFLNAIMKWIAS
ncbi:MAG: hypothetical protein PHO02_04305 [Candidatus Nanoarchaeia archaeon]|nr:hypothetical protein [Candidatus Nanoarchaeia archaeon]